jgi:cyanophycinase
MGSPVSIDNLRVHVMSIFDTYNLHKHELKINKAVRVEEGVYIKDKQ